MQKAVLRSPSKTSGKELPGLAVFGLSAPLWSVCSWSVCCQKAAYIWARGHSAQPKSPLWSNLHCQTAPYMWAWGTLHCQQAHYIWGAHLAQCTRSASALQLFGRVARLETHTL